ncbi:flagellar hook-length control protein FliK [Pseudomonas sp. P5_152]|uniref:flagellar hook-length control protein FliK n=1 Tax=Pseudomonas sp. P5_152 TaxID=3043442 RepID=UPI002A3656FA|nr:flagellar hook-length control protein FliK [Pseudomonas sp. P5_152]MDX9667538.1 flagellar hook-length control protein FliK [Pseudomonas sp. P5_152]
MPLSPNILLQAGAQAKTQSASANAPAAPVDKASGFARVFAGQGAGKSLAAADMAAKPLRDKTPDHPVRADKPATQAPAVAASGKTLPAEKVAPEEVTDTEPGAVAEDATVDPAQAQAATLPAPVTVVETPASVDPAIEAALLATTQAISDPAFDPEADPLDGLPAVRLAMEQSGHLSASSQAQAKTPPAAAQVDGEPNATQTFAAGMASMLGLQAEQDGTSEGGEKAFSGLIDEGLKDLKAASSDTRVEGFADRLAALTQAATAKTANALPVNQPIAMHQSGWTEEVVNRVMYLSSANLKAADIQLQPAELGRLDIRVNMIPDQQTQVTFMSAHVGVREALDGQMHRLREMFAQQGMGQVDVNVSDQSRGSQEQAQQGQGARTSATGSRLEPMVDESPASLAEVSASAVRVMGSSVVDYYA